MTNFLDPPRSAPRRIAQTGMACLGLCAMLLAACSGHAPSGQVVASVNGQEITLRDLQAEVAASNMAPGPNSDKQALDRIIERRLVAAEGHRLGIDKSPAYLAMVERNNDVALGSQTVASWAQELPAPSAPEIKRFIATHPNSFSDRRLIDLDQFETGRTDVTMDALRPVKTMAEMEALFQSHNVPIERRHSVLDTATIPKEVAAQVLSQLNGEPIVERAGDHWIVSAVTGARPAPLPMAQWNALATNQIKQATLQARLAALRKSAKIDYQSGFDRSGKLPNLGGS